MKSAEAQLREIQLALKYCDLDYEAILEDYREHLKELKRKRSQESRQKMMIKQSMQYPS